MRMKGNSNPWGTAKCAIVNAIFVTLLLGLVFLISTIYWDKYVIRDQEHSENLALAKMCNDSALNSNDKIRQLCKQNEYDMRKDPYIYATKDVICLLLPCTVLTDNRADSLAELIVNAVSEMYIKLVVLFLVSVIIYYLIKAMWYSHTGYWHDKGFGYFPNAAPPQLMVPAFDYDHIQRSKSLPVMLGYNSPGFIQEDYQARNIMKQTYGHKTD